MAARERRKRTPADSPEAGQGRRTAAEETTAASAAVQKQEGAPDVGQESEQPLDPLSQEQGLEVALRRPPMSEQE